MWINESLEIINNIDPKDLDSDISVLNIDITFAEPTIKNVNKPW